MCKRRQTTCSRGRRTLPWPIQSLPIPSHTQTNDRTQTKPQQTQTYALLLKADLDGAVSVKPAPHTSFCIDVAAGSEERTNVIVDPTGTVAIEGSKGTCHLQIKLPGMKQPASISVVETGAYTASGSFGVVAKLECRGVEVTAWRPHPDTAFVVEAESGKEFGDMDLSEEVSEYDEDAGAAVSVLEIETKVEKK